jgi:hypothetical protein
MNEITLVDNCKNKMDSLAIIEQDQIADGVEHDFPTKTNKISTKNSFFLVLFAFYFLKVHLHHSLKVMSIEMDPAEIRLIR